MEEMVNEGKSALVDAGLSLESISYSYSVDMRYLGQQTEITVSLGETPPSSSALEKLEDLFRTEYENIYGLSLEGMDLEIVAWRVSSFSTSDQRAALSEAPSLAAQPKGQREVHFSGGRLLAEIYDRETLGSGQLINGPCIVEERETTIFVLPSWQVTVQKDGALVAERMGQKQ
jgi:N-methylhydantoinase A